MKKAFTLIELLIVIAIIGILAAILFVSIGTGPIINSRDTKRVADLQGLRTALSLYGQDKASYPADAAALSAALVTGTPKYLGALPTDPLAGVAAVATTPANCGLVAPALWAANFGDIGVAAGDHYGYSYIRDTPSTFTLSACLESDTSKSLASDCDTGQSCHPDTNGVAGAAFSRIFDITQ